MKTGVKKTKLALFGNNNISSTNQALEYFSLQGSNTNNDKKIKLNSSDEIKLNDAFLKNQAIKDKEKELMELLLICLFDEKIDLESKIDQKEINLDIKGKDEELTTTIDKIDDNKIKSENLQINSQIDNNAKTIGDQKNISYIKSKPIKPNSEKIKYLKLICSFFEKNDINLMNTEYVLKRLFTFFEKFFFRTPKYICKIFLCSV